MTTKKTFGQYKLFVLFVLLTFNGKAQITQTSNASNNQNKLILIDKNKSYKNEHLFIQDIAKNVEYIKLETTDNCLIGKEQLVESIQCTKNDIFIIEAFTVYRFARKDGKFLNSIGKRGEGPGEYVTAVSFAINEKKQEVLMLDIHKNKVLIYKYNGTFVRDFNLPDVSRLNLIDENTLACYTEDTQRDIPGFGLYSLSDGKMIKKLSTAYTSRSGTNYRLIPQYTTPRVNNGDVFFSTYVTDTIFSVNKNGRTPRYAFLPPNNGKTTKERESCSTPFLLCETDLFANIQVYGSKGNTSFDSYIINKKTGTISKGFIIDREYSNGIFTYNTGMNNEITTLYYTYLLKERDERGVLFGKLKEITKTLKEEDNPVLMIATF